MPHRLARAYDFADAVKDGRVHHGKSINSAQHYELRRMSLRQLTDLREGLGELLQALAVEINSRPDGDEEWR